MAENQGYDIATAYIRIMPSTEKFGSTLKGEMDSEGEAAGSTFSDGFKKGLAAIGIAAAAASAAVGKVMVDSIGAYANYEQLIGGVETLFKDSADIVSEYADNAYKTAGLSANEYMETVTSFSASLLQSLDGDTQKAAEYADMAITDMSDNANKMGTSMESIQYAYQGFAKQNYTMLDNLKLGYGGTKSEMERLIEDAEKLDSSFKASRNENGKLTLSYADVVDAIHIVQTEMGITGTTAKEASETISGSISSMKAAWENLLTGLGNSSSDIQSLVDDFTGTFETAMGNLLPAVETVFDNISSALPKLVRSLLPFAVNTITNMLPDLIESVSGIIMALGEALPEIVGNLVKVLPEILMDLFADIGSILGSLLPNLAEAIGTVLLNLPSMLIGAIGGIVTGIANMFTGIMDAIDEAISPRFSEEDGAFANTIAAFETNGEHAFSEAANNLKMTWARVIGNTDWQDALNNLTLAQDTLDAVYEEYNSFKADLEAWSPEAAQLDYEIKAGTVTSLIDQISSLVDENGNSLTLTNGSLLETLAQQVNELLGEEVLTVEENTLVEAIIKQVQAAYDAGEDPYTVVRDFLDEKYPDLTHGGVDYDTLTELSIQYNTSQQTESPEDFLRRELKDRGWDDANIETICNLLAKDGDVKDAWFGKTNGAFAAAVKERAGIPDSIDIDAVVSMVLSGLESGEDMDTVITKLKENFGEGVDWDTVVELTVNGLTDVDKALEDLEKLTYATYAQKSAEMAMDETMSLKRQWKEETEAFAESYQQYLDAIAQGEYGVAETALQAAQTHRDALQGMQGTADEASQAYILAMANIQAANEGTDPFSSFEELERQKPQFVASMGEVMGTMTGFTGELTDVDQQLLGTAHEILENQGGLFNGWNQLTDEARNQIALALESATTWGQVATDMEISTEQVDTLKNLLSEYFTTFGDEIGVSADRIQGWLEYNDQLMPAVEELGLSWDELAQIMSVLADNEKLAQGSTDELETAIEEITPTEEDYSQATSDMAEVTADAAEAISENMQAGIDATQQALEDGSSTIITTAEEMESGIEDAISPIEETMPEYGDEGASGLNSAVSAWKDPLSATLTDMSDRFNTVFGVELPPAMGLWGYNAGERYDANLSLAGEDIKGTASDIADSIESSFSSLEWKLEGEGYMAGSALSNGLSSGLADVYYLGYDAGDSAGAGIYNGLESWYGSISNLAWNMANEINNAARSALDINSPSRVMMEVGEYTAEGLAIGLDKGSEQVLSQVYEMTDGVIDISGSSNIVQAVNQGNYDYSRAIGDLQSQSGENNDISDTLAQIVMMLDKLSRMRMVTDTGALVGELAEPMNEEFNAIRLREERG